MPKEVAVALIALGGVALGAAIGGGFGMASLVVNRRFAVNDRDADYREWYRRTLFEKRLNAAQDGYAWVMKMLPLIGGASPDPGQAGSDGNRALAACANAAREWYDHNSALLGGDEMPSSSAFIGLTGRAVLYANGHQDNSIWEAAHDAAELCRKRANELLELEQRTTDKRGE